MADAGSDVVPEVQLVGEDGRVRALSSLLAEERTVLFFLRAPGCPACLGHARKLVAAQGEGRLAVPVVLVTPGAAEDAATVARRVRPGARTTVVASGDAHRLVGLPKRLLMQHSGTFLVSPDRGIRYARTAAMPTGSYDEGELLRFLAGDQTAAP